MRPTSSLLDTQERHSYLRGGAVKQVSGALARVCEVEVDVRETRKAPLLIAPAGFGKDHVRAAVENGADAIYLGLKRSGAGRNAPRGQLSARLAVSCYEPDEFEEAVAYCRKHGVDVYLTLNKVFNDEELEHAYAAADYAAGVGVSALIVSDPALMRWVRDNRPGMRMHVSIIGGSANSRAVEHYRAMGASRVVLENNLSVDALRLMRTRTGVQVEVFVYGFICMPFHTFCFLGALTHGATLGSVCRTQCGQMVDMFLPDGKTVSAPCMRVRDLDGMEAIPALADAGVDALKIEGRLRSARYVAVATAAARHFLDSWKAGRNDPLPERLRRRLDSLPLTGAGPGYLGAGYPEVRSLARDNGAAMNKLRDLASNPGLAAFFAGQVLSGKLSRPKLPSPPKNGVARSLAGREGKERCPERRDVVVDVMLRNPVIPRGADIVYVGEKHCALRFLEHAEGLSALLEQIRATGAEPGLTVPGRVSELHVDRVVDVVRKLAPLVRRVVCYDPGIAVALSREFDVTMTTSIHGRAGLREVMESLGAKGIRHQGLPLLRYWRDGFPDVPMDLHVFGHLPISGGLFCLTRLTAPCPACRQETTRMRHRNAALRLNGSTVYSDSVASAHLLRDVLLRTPVRGFLIDAFDQDAARLEAVIRFWKGEGEWEGAADGSGERLCNGMYLTDDLMGPATRVPWDYYVERIAEWFR